MGEMQDKRARLERLTANESWCSDICASVCEGLALTEIAHNYGVSYSGMMRFIRSDKQRSDAVNQAIRDRDEYLIERIREELTNLSFTDIRELYDDSGALKPVSLWPDKIARSVHTLDVMEVKEDGAKVGEVKKLKLYDKLKALDSIGNILGLFKQKIEHSADESLEALILKQGNVTKP